MTKLYLLFLLTIGLISLAEAGVAECAYLKGSKLVPVNKIAVGIAGIKKWKTCGKDATSGFRRAAKVNGHSGMIVPMTKARYQVYDAYLDKLAKGEYVGKTRGTGKLW